ncbi:hypothetical protein SAMN05192554_13224, partial [Haloarchaeobius iranensis]
MRVIRRCEDAMFDERANPEVTKGFAERLLVIAFIGGKRPQIARIPAG